MKLVGSYITPYAYFRVMALLNKTKTPLDSLNRAEFIRKFLASGYERALITGDMVQAMTQNGGLLPAQLCVVVSPSQMRGLGPQLLALQSQGAKLILAVQDLNEVFSSSVGEFADEILVLFDNKKDLKHLSSRGDFSKIRFLFSYEKDFFPLDERLRQLQNYGIVLQPSAYFELWPLPEMSSWYDPEFEVLADYRDSERNISFSAIIPFQDNPDELRIMLKSLSISCANKSDIEVLVLDDSYELDHVPDILSDLENFQIPAVYVKIKRLKSRVRGDFSFRAGVCRNVGAILSRGQELVFIDSDILIGADFWRQLTRLREYHAGLVMARRHFLRNGLLVDGKAYGDFVKGEHTQLSWGGHWEDFYRDWENTSDIWRWTSTYCLAVSKNDFFAIGGFRRSFYCYGFEDTDLGYRLHQRKVDLKVLDSDVFHLPFQETRSEYAKDILRRKKLLLKSFEVFERSVLNPRLSDFFKTVLS